MAVELDVMNPDWALAPGMYPSVKRPVRGHGAEPRILKTAAVTTTERTFVIRVSKAGSTGVDVKKGVTEGDLIVVLGNLQPGDMVVRRELTMKYEKALRWKSPQKLNSGPGVRRRKQR